MTDSALEMLASIPCIGSRKVAQTIVDEMRGRGWQPSRIARPVLIADPGAPHHPLVEAYRPDDPMPAERQRETHAWEATPFDP